MKILKPLVLSLVLLFLITACDKEEKQKEKIVEFGSAITFDYAAGFDNGTLFDTSFEQAAKEAGIFNQNRIYQPERVEIGKDPLILGLMEALLGMREGEVKNIRISPAKAYGEFIENSTARIPKELFADIENARVNDLISLSTPQGQIPVYIKEIGEENITVDLNHPLAGKYIQFAIIVKSIELKQ